MDPSLPSSSRPPPPILPADQIFLMAFTWISFLVYANLIYIFITKQREQSILKSSFYRILVWNFLGDAATFFDIELIMRPRKFRFFDLFAEDDPRWLTNVSIFLTSTFRNVMDFSYLALASNRFTAVMYPLQHNKLWRVRNIRLLIISIWIVSVVATVLIFLVDSSGGGYLELRPSGVLQILAEEISFYDGIESAMISVTVSVVCFVLYAIIIGKGIKKLSLDRQQISSTEQKLVFCSICTTGPLMIEAVRSSLMIIAFCTDNMDLAIFSADKRYYCTELMIAVQCWSILLNIPLARKLFRKYGLFRSCFRVKKFVKVSDVVVIIS